MQTAIDQRSDQLSPYDSALVQLAPYSPYRSDGFAIHSPMVVEALQEMNRAEHIDSWLTDELPNLVETKKTALFVSDEHWRAYLGNRNAYSAWVDYFEQKISAKNWSQMLALWVERLQEGYVADATHGIIRVGHIVRALSHEVTEARLRELARALAYWSNCYARPDFVCDAYEPSRSAEQILAGLSLVPQEKRNNAGSIVAAVERVPYADGFSNSVSRVDLTGDIDDRAIELARLFSRLFLTSVDSLLHGIVFTHAITSLAAVLNLRPHISEETCRALLNRSWETGAALHVVYSRTAELSAPPPANNATRESLVEAAVHHGDDHVIKLTEACLGFHERSGDTIFFDVAEKGAQHMTLRKRG